MSQLLETPCSSPVLNYLHEDPQVQSNSPVPLIPTILTSALTNAQTSWKKLFSGNTKTSHSTTRTTSLNTLNSRENTAWGDELGEKQPDTTRIYAINLNGLQLDARGGKFDSVCRTLKEVQADIFCGQEHNVDVTQSPLRTIIFDTASQHWERHRVAIDRKSTRLNSSHVD